MTSSMHKSGIIRNLSDGLVLRHATPADTDELADFNAHMHMEHGTTEPDHAVGRWVRELMSGNHPTFPVEDFLVVEDTATRKIVSTSNTISQVWEYGGVPFKVARSLVDSLRRPASKVWKLVTAA